MPHFDGKAIFRRITWGPDKRLRLIELASRAGC